MGDYRNYPYASGTMGVVQAGASEYGEIEYSGDYDVFQVALVAGLSYTFEMRAISTDDGSLKDPYLSVGTYNGGWYRSDDDSGVGSNALFTYSPSSSTLYYLTAQSYNYYEIGDYTVNVSVGRGTNGVNTVTGTSYADAIEVLGGNDSVNAGNGNDSVWGGDGNDNIRGGSGNDFIHGNWHNDIIRGQAGNDVLVGGYGADIIIGGSGADTFVYDLVNGSLPGARDQYRSGDGGGAFDGVGAASGDVFDLSAIDANVTAGGNQAFRFGGTSQMGTGYLWLQNQGTDTILFANTDRDAQAEFQVEIEDGSSVLASMYRGVDFIL